jgi:uncharacterized protein YdeI (YjbR/CyaY-like superfamily)
MKAEKEVSAGLPIVAFKNDTAWERWLAKNHARSAGLWIKLAKAGTGTPSVSYSEALNTALCFGWIDGQKRGGDAFWLQKFTPRGARSIWSKRNRERVAALRKAGRMRDAGEAEVARARKDGRWEAAYDSPKTSAVPADFQAELGESKAAAAFFATLNGANRYAILWRIQTAKKPGTRAKRIRDFIAMLEKKEKPHP